MARSRYAVFGAGRYGTQIALSLAQRGAEVFTFDADPGRAELLKEDVALAVTLDATDKKALMAQHVEDLDAAVVAIGENFEATVLTTLNLLDLGLASRHCAGQRRQPRTHPPKPWGHRHSAAGKRGGGSGQRATHQPQHSRLFVPSGRLRNRGNQSPRGVSRTSLGGHGLGEPLRIAVDHHPTRIQGNGRRRGPCVREHILGVPKPDTTIEATDTLVVFGSLGAVQRFLDING